MIIRIALALVAFAATTASTERTFTLASVHAMTPGALKSTLLGEAGRTMREVEVQSRGGTLQTLSSVEFAAAPRSSGFEGLCVADTARVWLGKPDRAGNDPAVRVTGFATGERFAILPEFIGMGDSDREVKRLEAACAKAGSVLTRWQPTLRRGFFSGVVEYRDVIKAPGVSFAIRAMTAARKAPLPCPPPASKAACTEQAARFAAFDWRRVSAIELKPCSKGAPNWCVDILYDDDGGHTLVILIETGATMINAPADIEVRAVRLGFVSSDL